MLRKVFRSRMFFVGLLLFVLIVVGGVLSLKHAEKNLEGDAVLVFYILCLTLIYFAVPEFAPTSPHLLEYLPVLACVVPPNRVPPASELHQRQQRVSPI